jgi:hypothetical protein
MGVHPTVTASTMITRFEWRRKVRCHKGAVEIVVCALATSAVRDLPRSTRKSGAVSVGWCRLFQVQGSRGRAEEVNSRFLRSALADARARSGSGRNDKINRTGWGGYFLVVSSATAFLK